MTAEPAIEPDSDDDQDWPLSKTFDLVAIVLVSAVLARAIAGIVAAASVPTLDISQSAYASTFLRLAYGTQWADLTSGLLLLGSLGLVLIPRVAWDPAPDEQWLRVVPKLVMGVCVLASLAAVAGVTDIVNVLWHPSSTSTSTESLTIAEAVAALGLALLGAVLAWFSMGYVEEDLPPDEGEKASEEV